MAKAKKFGTFSGVFTPSILTILGVIMYLRFPAIVGQAGLINAIAIIFIAHIISITTSLSVASLSTDKPVQGGGTYFMISRSLGLPIGGTLGLALFVGLSFSVSLYLIGFAESFLQYWQFDNSINSIRLTGSIVLLAVTTITFISTSLAIKSQYFIMVAIVLSLVSIFFGKHDFAPTEINLEPIANAAPFMLLFGIFFPAVTGFEAGVSMSGDLKDPKKSLPLGAILAVGVGFVAYVGLALFFSFTVDYKVLVGDPEVLFKISLVPGLVIAGIWGATLSSAFGSILGGPRILQAIAMDKIAPKFLARGTGRNNEPRYALVMAFLIAEVGILIGDLNVIARIVSMFFITTYAFLNLASAIESWSSSDFRPAFKIPRFVSVLGALSSFIVMILLDFLALAGATVVLGLLYFFLQRKELILESGDAWSSFWTNLAKRALLKLSATKDNTRNWRPNIVLFSGDKGARPHLIEMGLSLTGKLGALTKFNLITSQQNSNVEKEPKQNRHFFSRKLYCDSIENGIKTVTSVYGFSGFEPNMVLMGWSNQDKNQKFIINILKDIRGKKQSLAFLDYNKENGFGNKEKIDIWWNGKGRFLSFVLNILRFLQSSSAWRDAKVRLMIVNSDTSLTDDIYRNTATLLSEKRMQAEIRILNDDFGTRTKEDIIHAESAQANLIIVGMSQKESSLNEQYIDSVHKISDLPVSTLILFPSSEFEEINLIDKLSAKPIVSDTHVEVKDLPLIPTISNEVVNNRLRKLDLKCIQAGENFIRQFTGNAVAHLQNMLLHVKEITIQNKQVLEKEINGQGSVELHKSVSRNHQSFLRSITSIVNNQNSDHLKEIVEIIDKSIAGISANLGNEIYEMTDSILIPFKVSKKKKEKNLRFPLRNYFSYQVDMLIYPKIMELLNNFEQTAMNQFFDLRKIIFGINDVYEKITLSGNIDGSAIIGNIEQQISNIEVLIDLLDQFKEGAEYSMLKSFRDIIITMANDLDSPESLIKSRKKVKKQKTGHKEQFNSFVEDFGNGISMLNKTLYLDVLVLAQKDIAYNIISKSNEKINNEITLNLLKPLDELEEFIQELVKNEKTEKKTPTFTDRIALMKFFNESFKKVSDMLEEMPEELIVPRTIFKDSQMVALKDYNPVTIFPQKTSSYYLDILYREPYYREIENLERTVRSVTIESKEVKSLLLFHLNNLDKAGEEEDANIDKTFYQKLISQVANEKQNVLKSLNEIKLHFNAYLHDTFSKLFYHAILESEKTIHVEKREFKGKKLTTGLINRINKLRVAINTFVVYIINSASSGQILSKKYLEEQSEEKLQNRQVLDFIEQITPHKNVYHMVPVFYRSLMSSISKISNEFWVPRNNGTKVVKEALQRHKNGVGGAVFIKGVHGAGKTALSRHVATHLFKKNNIFWVDPPVNGSTKQEDLLKVLQKSFTGFYTIDGILSNMPYGSTIIFNNLELWWERRPGGGELILKIIELIKSYGNKVFFILNCNAHSFSILKKLFDIEENALAIINCEAFNAKELQQLILSRHKSSGISLSYRGRDENDLSQLHYSILFNAYFNTSRGIPGIAMNSWKANIAASTSNSITIEKPDRPNPDILNNIQEEWLIIIALFVQHKNIGIDKLSRLLGCGNDCAERHMLNLKNAGLLVLKSENTYALGRNVEPYLVDLCVTKGIL